MCFFFEKNKKFLEICHIHLPKLEEIIDFYPISMYTNKFPKINADDK